MWLFEGDTSALRGRFRRSQVLSKQKSVSNVPQMFCAACRSELSQADRRDVGPAGSPAAGSNQSECAVHLQTGPPAAGAGRRWHLRVSQQRPRHLAAEALLGGRPPVAEKAPAERPGLPACVRHLRQVLGPADA